jgi:hypothetical protein
MHRFFSRNALSGLAALVLLSGSYGCGGGADCGPGTELVGDKCLPSSSGHGPEAERPTFAGVEAVSPASTTSLFFTWSPATDDKTPQDRLRYSVFVSADEGGQLFDLPDAIVQDGGTSYLATGLDAASTYYVVVRAMDEEHNQDDNTVEKSGKPQDDDRPPTFAGATSAAPAAGGKVHIEWKAGSDDLTATESLVYVVWGSATTPVDTSGEPRLATAPGALSADVVVPEPNTTYHFVVRARDAAGNTDDNEEEVSSKPGPDKTPPTFEGCTSVKALDAGTIEVKWKAASDNSTPANQMKYVVYGFKTAGPHADVSEADAEATFVGALEGDLGGLSPDTTYHVLCRAQDASGNEDDNAVEKSAKTLKDSVNPTFGGLVNATHGNPQTTRVRLTWNAAQDNQTPPGKMKYDIYQATTPGGQDFGAPPEKTVTGVEEAVVTVSPATTYYWVVRARDLGGNGDDNNIEGSLTTFTSFAVNVNPQFSICQQCHGGVNGNKPQLEDNADTSYQWLTSVWISGTPPNEVEHLDVIPFDLNSTLYLYTNWVNPLDCPYMPYDLCESKLSQAQLKFIRDWILEGALFN